MSEAWQPTAQNLLDFVYREARLLDERKYEDWYELFDDDGVYWVPLSADQTDAATEQSLAHENKLLLRLRLERLKSPRVYAHQPTIFAQHVLQAPTIESKDHAANIYLLRTAFFYTEAQRGGLMTLTGTVKHQLRLRDGALRIVLKRIDLLNAKAAQSTIYLFP